MSAGNQKQCIVLLPSGPRYERLFEEILHPVFIERGFVPRRLQLHQPLTIPIDLFVDEIEQADALFADVSLNVPEIWIAAGCAAALGKPLCLISSSQHTASSLGIQYLPLISYPADALPSDYLHLQHNIAVQLSATQSTIPAPDPEIHAPFLRPQLPPTISLPTRSWRSPSSITIPPITASALAI